MPVPAVLSNEMDNIVVLYGNSSDNTWNALAFQVNQMNRRIDRVSNLPTLSPGGTLDFGYLGEDGHSQDVSSPGKDQLRVGDNREETITEFGLSVKPAGVLVGVENPADDAIAGIVDADRIRGYSPQASNAQDFADFGSVNAQHTYTDTEVPTTATAPSPNQGHIRWDRADDDLNNTYVGFRNLREDDAPLEALTWGATYKVSVVKSSQVVRNMAFGDGYKRRVVTYGGLQNNSPKRPDAWKQGEITLTSDDALSALSNRGGS